MFFNMRSKISHKILNFFFLNESKKMYINALAKLIEEEPKNVYRILLRLEESGLLLSEFIGKERYFSINKKNPLYTEYKNIFLKTIGIEEILKNKVTNIHGLKEAFIFGSYANKGYDSHSDIDILLIGEHRSLEAQKVLYKVQKVIGREINIINIRSNEFKIKKKNNDQFIKDVFNKKTIKLL
ncbi:MAG: nucleotidyltransferase domain-containing protein [bacterium]